MADVLDDWEFYGLAVGKLERKPSSVGCVGEFAIQTSLFECFSSGRLGMRTAVFDDAIRYFLRSVERLRAEPGLRALPT